jgi:hypothetical protein
MYRLRERRLFVVSSQKGRQEKCPFMFSTDAIFPKSFQVADCIFFVI